MLTGEVHMKKLRFRALIFFLIIFTFVFAGYAISLKNTRYKEFFIEKHAVTAEAADNRSDNRILININTDNEDELSNLYGIGKKLSQRIINYRKKNGNFEVIQDIMRVNGIGKKKFEEIKDYICVE